MTWKISGRLESTCSERAALTGCEVDVFFEHNVHALGRHHGAAMKLAVSSAKGSEGDKDAKPRKKLSKKDDGASPSAAGATIQGRVSARTNESGRFDVSLPD